MYGMRIDPISEEIALPPTPKLKYMSCWVNIGKGFSLQMSISEQAVQTKLQEGHQGSYKEELVPKPYRPRYWDCISWILKYNIWEPGWLRNFFL